MNTSITLVAIAFSVVVLTRDLCASPRTSANYSIVADTVDTGGRRTSSATYANDGSVGAVVGISTVPSPPGSAKAGYIGQLYEIAGFALSNSQSSVPEGFTLQLAAGHLLDDGTLLPMAPTLVSWSVVSGPIVSISAGGLATAGIVYQDTSATVQGSFGAATASLNLTVLDVNPDNFGTYAGDGVWDDWQVLYFGLPPNAAAGPLLDPDGDGQNNRFEWIAGLVPTDAISKFKLNIVGSAQGAHLIFSPTVAGRTYTVKYGFDFLDVPNWLTLMGGTIANVGNQRTVTDTSAQASPKKYYRIEISK